MSDTFNEALAAFQQDLPQSEPEPEVNSPSTDVPTVPEQNVEPTPQSSDQGQPDETASRDIDLSGLPEEAQIYLRAREREMTADYTRKTQEAAQQRQEAQQALEFLTQLNTDRDFATQVLNQLQTNLGVGGPTQPEYEVDEFGQVMEPDPYSKEIAELKQWRDRFEQEAMNSRMEAQLANDLSAIRSQHTDYTHEDEQDIVALGFATQGDLRKANEIYRAIGDRFLVRYLETKKRVQAPAQLPASSGTPAEQQIRGEEALRAAALERIRAELG